MNSKTMKVYICKWYIHNAYQSILLAFSTILYTPRYKKSSSFLLSASSPLFPWYPKWMWVLAIRGEIEPVKIDHCRYCWNGLGIVVASVWRYHLCWLQLCSSSLWNVSVWINWQQTKRYRHIANVLTSFNFISTCITREITIAIESVP